MDSSHKDTNTWNYRIFKHPGKDGNADTYALHECHYTDGKIVGFTSEPQSAHYESGEGMVEDLEMLLKSARSSQESILDYTALTQAMAEVE